MLDSATISLQMIRKWPRNSLGLSREFDKNLEFNEMHTSYDNFNSLYLLIKI